MQRTKRKASLHDLFCWVPLELGLKLGRKRSTTTRNAIIMESLEGGFGSSIQSDRCFDDSKNEVVGAESD